jgi:hypothetical protein
MKDRYIAVAYKRQIGKLLMIAGPTSAGKSTLVEKLKHGKYQEVINKLQLSENDLSNWTYSAPSNLEKLCVQKTERLIYHYDFLLPHKHQLGGFYKDCYLDILTTATQKTILTIWTPPTRLKNQLIENEIKNRKKPNKANLKILKEYEDPVKILSFYSDWIKFLRSLNVEHHIVELSEGVRFYSPQEWEEKFL